MCFTEIEPKNNPVSSTIIKRNSIITFNVFNYFTNIQFTSFISLCFFKRDKLFSRIITPKA